MIRSLGIEPERLENPGHDDTMSLLDITLLLEMVLEGIHRGIGMDRTLLALMTPDRSSLRTKLVLGTDRERLNEQFSFRMDQPGQIRNLIAQQRSLEVDPAQSPWDTRLRHDAIGEICQAEIWMKTGQNWSIRR